MLVMKHNKRNNTGVPGRDFWIDDKAHFILHRFICYQFAAWELVCRVLLSVTQQVDQRKIRHYLAEKRHVATYRGAVEHTYASKMISLQCLCTATKRVV